MKHWQIDQVAWGGFDPGLVAPAVAQLVKAAALVERNATDYGVYLNNIFRDDPDICQAIDNWVVEEVQHGEALGRWAMLADPAWDFAAAFARFRSGYQIPLEAKRSVRGSLTGELIARCMVEIGTSSYYTALAGGTREPVLAEICRLIAADEFRHYKLFYDHERRWLERERIGLFGRIRIGAGRVGESEDDELAFAWHAANEPPTLAYDRRRCAAAYLARAMEFYRFEHVERGMGMAFKAVGLPPRGRLSNLSARLAWRLVQYRQRQCARRAA
jgi:hypothetical protein